MSESKSTPAMISARIQQWAILLGGYHYRIEYKPGQQNTNTDAFSRIPLLTVPENVPTPLDIVHMMELLDTTLRSNLIESETIRDEWLDCNREFTTRISTICETQV